jgi:large subunit ribosomal protein L4
MLASARDAAGGSDRRFEGRKAMEVAVLNMSGKSVGALTIDEETLGGVINPALIKQAYVRYHANKRQGSARTRNRGNVEGSTRKLYRQKGTGNARVGPARVPNRKGGGVAFAKTKTKQDYRLDLPVKMRRLANRNALLAKLMDGEVRVLDSLSMKTPGTGEFRKALEACKIDRTCLVALGEGHEATARSARNIDDVTLVAARNMTCFEMLNCRYLVIQKSDLEAWLGGAGAHTGKDAKHITRTKSAAKGGAKTSKKEGA